MGRALFQGIQRVAGSIKEYWLVHKYAEGNRNDTKPLAMNFFRRFKDYVLGEDLKPTSESLSEPSSSSTASAGFVQKVAVKQTVQPVLQNPGYGSSGGVQGLDWYTQSLKEDQDGDVASEFLEEPSTPSSAAQRQSALDDAPASLKVQKKNLRPAGPGCVIVHEGDVHLVSSER